MFHHSHLKEHAPLFPADKDGNVPEHCDDWRKMNFDHGALNPEEPGISAEERQRRLDYLDKEWWPNVLGQVRKEHDKLKEQGYPTPFKQWMDAVRPGQGGDVRPGFDVASLD